LTERHAFVILFLRAGPVEIYEKTCAVSSYPRIYTPAPRYPQRRVAAIPARNRAGSSLYTVQRPYYSDDSFFGIRLEGK